MLAKCVFLAVLVTLVRSESDDVLLASAHNTLAVNLLKHLTAESPSENVFFSPTSIATAFGMAYAGARGSSEAELASALGHTAFNLTDRPRVLAAYKKLLELAASPNVTLEVANMVLAQNNFDVSDNYKQQLHEVFDAELRSVDFANEGPRVAAEVNSWVRDKTRGKISSILPEGPPLDIILFILNAVYFKGTWVTKFDACPNGGQALFQWRNHRDTRTGVDQVRDGLSLPVLEDLAHQLSFRDVILRLPKFDMSLRYNLVPAMRAMGLDGVFGSRANFTGISESPLVRISDAVHKATVEVNEEGTVATAVTGISFMPLSAHYQPPPPVEFIVDHPFIFYIRDRNTNRMLFIGEVKHL
ncbi:hypothetical protein HPB48_004919 [Haemaphysalis longicornis]|uniref:Serpin domain-containing protein n=1 Tax=Haemaphysalis longicornis TaxID=44386 RepID=A0A9J6G450_HAELO|nr:hypothetical protein HPB48_004919 [Haemaphysalis longicornis]